MSDAADPARFHRLRELFDAALAVPADARAQWIAAHTGDDTALAAELGELLRYDHTTVRLPFAMAAAAAPGSTVEHRPDVPGLRLGAELGSGAMGTVYEAEQQEPRRRVAVKVLREAPLPGLRERFQRECELLARLEHPNIARILFVGRTADGRPFLAMELVAGPTLQAWMRGDHALADRVALLRKLCAAVEHAHQRGVLHRDLKPSNVLVAAGDEPKVVDFGVARLLEPPPDSSLTQARELIGTLAYMSPEQLGGDTRSIDTRADVHALGVIAYELLSGHLPYDVRGKSITEIVRMFDREEPTRLGRHGAALRGDLEAIVATATARDREARYASASLLDADLARYQRHEPISVGHTSTIGLVRKWTRRHRGLAAGLAATVASLAVGLGVSLAAWRDAAAAAIAADGARAEATQRRDEAVAEVAVANDVVSRLESVLMLPAATGQPPDIRFADVLALAAARLDRPLEARPAVVARLRTSMARAMLHVGKVDEALHQIALAPAAETLTDSPRARGNLLLTRGNVLLAAGRLDEAAALTATLDDLLEHPETARPARELRARLALARGDIAGAEREAAALAAPAPDGTAAPAEHQLVAIALRSDARLAADDLEGARAAGRAMEAPALVLAASRDEELSRLVLAVQTRLVQAGAARMTRQSPPPSWRSLLGVGRSLLTLDDPQRAERLLRDALAQVLAPAHPDDGQVMTVAAQLGRCLSLLGRHAESAELFATAEAAALRTHVPANAEMARLNRCIALVRAGEPAAAVAGSEGLLEIFARDRRSKPEFDLCKARGNALTRLGRFAEAERLLLRMVAIATAEAGAPAHVPELVELYEAWQRPDEAARWRGPRRD